MAADKTSIVNILAGEELTILEEWSVQKLTFRGTNSDGLSMETNSKAGGIKGGGSIIETDSTSGFTVIANTGKLLTGITISSASGTGTGDIVMQS